MKKLRILLFGARGRLGSMLLRQWSDRHEVRGLSRDEIDVSDLKALDALLKGSSCDVIVNATGATSLEACEDAPETARILNAEVPALMAQAANDALCIHFSTDYVFDGKLDRPYREDDPANPLSAYGKTKLQGEEAVLAASPRHLCFRVSWVFGPDKPSFIDGIVARACREDRVEAVEDKTSCPTYAKDVTDWLVPFLDGSLPGGIYHACNSGVCSWKEFAEGALEVWSSLGRPLKTRRVEGIPMSSVTAFRATRPRHTPMDCTKLSSAIGKAPRPWQEAVAEYFG